MILLIDNFDSFTYNLVHQVAVAARSRTHVETCRVVRNNDVTVEEIRHLDPVAIILSPGPGRPEDSGICPRIISELSGDYPILGVCLGHQAICQQAGARITYAPELVHGKSSLVSVRTDDVLFAGLGERVQVGRYHSLVADPATLPEHLVVTAQADDGEIMAVTHSQHPTYGVQFHPESILTPQGTQMMDNFLTHALAVRNSRNATVGAVVDHGAAQNTVAANTTTAVRPKETHQ